MNSQGFIWNLEVWKEVSRFFREMWIQTSDVNLDTRWKPRHPMSIQTLDVDPDFRCQPRYPMSVHKPDVKVDSRCQGRPPDVKVGPRCQSRPPNAKVYKWLLQIRMDSVTVLYSTTTRCVQAYPLWMTDEMTACSLASWLAWVYLTTPRLWSCCMLMSAQNSAARGRIS